MSSYDSDDYWELDKLLKEQEQQQQTDAFSSEEGTGTWNGDGSVDNQNQFPMGQPDNDATAGWNGDSSVDDGGNQTTPTTTTTSTTESTAPYTSANVASEGTTQPATSDSNTTTTTTNKDPFGVKAAEDELTALAESSAINIQNNTPTWDSQRRALIQYKWIKDANGNIVRDPNDQGIVIHDFSGIYDQMEGFDGYMEQLAQKLAEGQVVEYAKSLQDFLGVDTQEMVNRFQTAQQQYQSAMQALQDQASEVTNQIGGLTTDQGVRDAAEDWFARLAGFENRNQYIGSQQDMMRSLMQGIGGQQGLTEQERNMMQHSVNRNVGEQQKMMQRQIDAIMGTTGSTMQAIAMADEARQQISNTRLQGEMAIMLEDFARKQQNFENKKQIWGTLLEQGRITQQTFIDSIRQDKALQLQGLAVQAANMEAMFQGEMQSLQNQYNMAFQSWQGEANIHYQNENLKMQKMQNDIQIINTQINTLYNKVQLEMGIHQMALDTEQRFRENATELQQIQVDAATLKYTIAKDKQAEAKANANNIFKKFLGFAGLIAGIALFPLNPAAGATIAGGSLSLFA